MEKMKTATEMTNYATRNGLSYYATSETKHFEIVERSLMPDEYVIVPLAPILHQDTFAVAFTNKRIVIAKKRVFGRSEFESISIDIVTSIHKEPSSFGIVRVNVNTLEGQINMDFNKKQAEKIISIISDFLLMHKNKQNNSTGQSSNSSADELKKYFELKKQGIISEEEFLKKKKQLMGL